MALIGKTTCTLIILNHTAKYFSTKRINKNLYLMSHEKPKINLENFVVDLTTNKALVVMPTWLMARDTHIAKYAKLYLDYGFDVLNVRLKLWQILWPVKGAQVVAGNILKFLEVNKSYSPLLLHGFSVGGYLWGEALVQIEDNREKYQSLFDRTYGQIWDSIADITAIPVGAPKAMFPNNKFLENALKSYIKFHMKAFEKVATRHYLKSRSTFMDNPLKTPMLILGSKIDPIATEEILQDCREYLENNGHKVYWKIWTDSPHVSHMFKHPKEYRDEVNRYLEDVKLISPKKKN